MNSTALVFLGGYAAVLFSALIGVVWWDHRRRRTRKPFPEDVKLMRMPGEYLWRRVIENDESDALWLMGIMLIPSLVGFMALHSVKLLFSSAPTTGLVLVVMVFAFSLLACVAWCGRRLQRRADDYLGFFGERYVAEWLDPLKADGWFLFVDVPCLGSTGEFNLDHVALCPGGIWVIETKTRRKGSARAGFEDYKVTLDGEKIIWPWGEDTHALRQASNNAEWLKEWLKKMTGKEFPVWPVLTLPGYEIREAKLGPVRVVYTRATAVNGHIVKRDELEKAIGLLKFLVDATDLALKQS